MEAAAAAVGGGVEGYLPPRHPHHTAGGGEEPGTGAGAGAAPGVLVVGPGAAIAAAVAAVAGVWGVVPMPPRLKLAPDLAFWDVGAGGGDETVNTEGCGGVGGDGGGGGGITIQATLVSSARADGGTGSGTAAHVAAAATAAGSEAGGREGGLGWTASTTDAGNVVVACHCRAAAAAAAAWLAGRPEVLWVAPHGIRGRWANQHARAVVAGGAVSPAVDPPLWSAGVRGLGEVVGIGDSGVDLASCFFRDPTGAAAGPAHRKVGRYRSQSVFASTEYAVVGAYDSWPVCDAL